MKLKKGWNLKFTNIEIHFIIGNHDHTNVIKLAEKYYKSTSRLRKIQIENQSITYYHYALRVWDNNNNDAWQLHGHTHRNPAPLRNQYDVGVDNNNFNPISFQELLVIMKVKREIY